MTPERAKELYDTARSMAEVIELFKSRPERAKEAHLLESLHPQHISDPMSVVRILRGMATDDEASARRYRDRAASCSLGTSHAQEEIRQAELRERRAKALLWAASVLTKGFALKNDTSDTP